jgi:enoyl-CoA hydratase/carnithine racemase
LGETFTADEALKLGLVDRVVLRDAGLQAAQDWAQRVAARGPIATQMVKALINAAEGEDQERALEMTAGAFAATTADLKEGVAAFRSKRKPEFGGR